MEDITDIAFKAIRVSIAHVLFISVPEVLDFAVQEGVEGPNPGAPAPARERGLLGGGKRANGRRLQTTPSVRVSFSLVTPQVSTAAAATQVRTILAAEGGAGRLTAYIMSECVTQGQALPDGVRPMFVLTSLRVSDATPTAPPTPQPTTDPKLSPLTLGLIYAGASAALLLVLLGAALLGRLVAKRLHKGKDAAVLASALGIAEDEWLSMGSGAAAYQQEVTIVVRQPAVRGDKLAVLIKPPPPRRNSPVGLPPCPHGPAWPAGPTPPTGLVPPATVPAVTAT